MNVAARSVTDELVLTRDIAAPRARVFAAWTDVRLASRWWAPRDFTTLSCEMDVRPGGAWLRRMRAPGGAVIVKHGIYREVVAPERLAFTYITEYATGIVDPETLVTVTFVDLGGLTRLTLRHTAFETDAARIDHQGGWIGALDRFAAFTAASSEGP
jgi:uncharacterized protein YndB with AHSA1/START domain